MYKADRIWQSPIVATLKETKMTVYLDDAEQGIAASSEARSAKWFMTGTTRCRDMFNAQRNVDQFNKPAVIREVDGFFEVTQLSRKPVQPGQFEFKIRDGEVIYNSG